MPHAATDCALHRLDDGQVYAMGNGSQGQLGLGPTVTHASSLQQVELGERAKRISCGPWTSAAITGTRAAPLARARWSLTSHRRAVGTRARCVVVHVQ